MNLAALSLAELAHALKTGVISYEQVETEYYDRVAIGLNPDAPRALQQRGDSIPAPIACPTCRRAYDAPIASHDSSSPDDVAFTASGNGAASLQGSGPAAAPPAASCR